MVLSNPFLYRGVVMSRIKGSYICGGQARVRWLDTVTGCLYMDSEKAISTFYMALGHNGIWQDRDKRYTFVPDAPSAADWYVIRMVPDERIGLPPMYTSFGPFTEEQARADAVRRSEMSARPSRGIAPKPYAVVQVQAGNTVLVQPPAPPAAVAHWS